MGTDTSGDFPLVQNSWESRIVHDCFPISHEKAGLICAFHVPNSPSRDFGVADLRC
jgi:hypothetical protein